MEECLINLNKDEDDERCLKFCYLGIMIDVIIHLLDYLMEPYIYFISVPRMEPSVIDKRFRSFCLCPPDVMFVTRGSKNSLFFVFDSLSNLDCGQ